MARTEVITYGDFEAPIGTVVAGVTFTIQNEAGAIVDSQNLAPGAQPAAVTLAAGTYKATAQAVDGSGNPVGPAATDTFTESAPTTVTVQIPVSITGADA